MRQYAHKYMYEYDNTISPKLSQCVVGVFRSITEFYYLFFSHNF
jgi:hypothetical protein